MTDIEICNNIKYLPIKEIANKLNLTDDYRDCCYDMKEDDVYLDNYEDTVVIDGSTLSAW